MSGDRKSSVKPISNKAGGLRRKRATNSPLKKKFSLPKRRNFSIVLGKENRSQFGLTDKDRQNHMHVIGSTGTGKSKFLELLLRQDVENQEAGICLLDPHGSLYDDVLHYVSHEKPELADRFILFNPAGESDHVIGFNPVAGDIERMDYLLDSLISACLKAWGQDSTDRTPRITKWLENIFYTLIANDLTLVESAPLLTIHNKEQRHALLRNVNNDLVLDDWRMFETSTNTQKQALIEGAANRLRKFLRNDIIRNIIGQQQNVLSFSDAMNQGKIVLINLNGQGKISHENAKLLGILLVNEIFRCAKLRDPRDTNLKPFYFYIDEFAQFITRDIARALEEARKFKLYLTLAHQHLAQLKSEDPYLYASVLTNCKSKVVFGGLSREDAELMAGEVATGFLDLKAIKDETFSTKERHRLELRMVKNKSKAKTEGEGQGNTEGQAHGSSVTHSESEGESETINSGENFNLGSKDFGENLARKMFGMGPKASGASRGVSHGKSRQSGVSETTSQNAFQSTTHATSKSETQTEGESETWVSVPEEYQEMSSRTFWSVQELENMQTAALKNQGVAQAFIKLSDQAPSQVNITKIEAPEYHTKNSPKSLDEFRLSAIESNADCFTPIADVHSERSQRQIDAFGEVLRLDANIVEIDELETNAPVKHPNDPFV